LYRMPYLDTKQEATLFLWVAAVARLNGVRRCALANKLARICYATPRDKESSGESIVRLSKEFARESFVMLTCCSES